jgi:hypothetical protein
MIAVTGTFPPSQHSDMPLGRHHRVPAEPYEPYEPYPPSEPYPSHESSWQNALPAEPYEQYDSPRRHRLALEAPRRPEPPSRGPSLGMVLGIGAIVLVVLAGIGVGITFALRPSDPAPDARPAAVGNPVTVKLGEPVGYEAGKISAEYLLTAGRPLTLTPSGSRPSRGFFLGLAASVTVFEGEVYLTDDNFILVTATGREFEPDVSFLFEGGLRGNRAGTGETTGGLVVWDIPPGSEVGAKVVLRLGEDGVRGTWQLP